MLVLTTSQVAAMSEGSVPEAMRGTIKKVWGRTETNKNPQYLKEGENPKGSLQKLIVSDGTTDLQVMIDDRDAFPSSIVGSSILVMAFKGDRGLVGLKRRSNEYPAGTINPQLWVNRSADVVIEGAGSTATPPARTQQPTAPANGHANGHANGNGHRPPATPPQSPATPPAAPAVAPGSPAARAAVIKDYKRRVAKAASGYEVCLDAAFGLVKRLDTRHKDAGGFKANADTIEKIAACLMVQACWNQKPADIEAFPIREFAAYDEGGNLIGAAPRQPADPAAPPFAA